MDDDGKELEVDDLLYVNDVNRLLQWIIFVRTLKCIYQLWVFYSGYPQGPESRFTFSANLSICLFIMQSFGNHRLPSLQQNTNSLVNSYNLDAVLESLKTKT